MAPKTTDNKQSVCKQCTTQITRGEDCIACEGFCHNAFHARCVKLSADTLLSCRTNPNVWWICDSCTHSMRAMRNDHSSRINQKEDNSFSPNVCGDLREKQNATASTTGNKCVDSVRDVIEEMFVIKQQIAEIQGSMQQMMPQRDNPFELSDCISSSSLCSTKLLHGSRRDHAFDLSCNTTFNDRFWLFFTKIKNTTTEKQINDMVSTSLGRGSGTVIVKKLVPFGKDTSTMQYISFKVGIDPALKDAALTASTWPVGVCYRPFINNDRY